MPSKKPTKSLQNNLNNFITQLIHDFPEFHFVYGTRFKFRPPRTIIIGPAEPHSEMLLLHELGHALLGHSSFTTDLSRLKMEAAAWAEARKLATRYRIFFDDDVAEDELDTYRDWLHQKSRCPICGLTRFQSPDGTYHCPRCENFCSPS